MIKALSVNSEQDLQPLSRYLWALPIAHRISEQAHQQILWVANEAEVVLVQSAYQRYQQGDLPATEMADQQAATGNDHSGFRQLLPKLRTVPCTSLLIIISVVATALLNTRLGNGVFDLLRMGTLDFMLESGQWWRLITPVFLHFGLMHLAFNMVLLWFFGRQLEHYESRRLLLILLLLFCVLPNLAQYLAVGMRFGGMSGVVYAVMGYCWLWNRLSPRPVYVFPNAIMGLMVAWLLIGFSGLLTRIGFPAMANLAHLGGLLTGLACAWAVLNIRRKRSL